MIDMTAIGNSVIMQAFRYTLPDHVCLSVCLCVSVIYVTCPSVPRVLVTQKMKVRVNSKFNTQSRNDNSNK